MFYGNLIKLERLNQKMKQVNLAKGICTSSYLSKIENNLIEPSEEILNLLFTKLNLEFVEGKLVSQEINDVYTSLNELYKNAVLNRDTQSFQSQIEQYEKKAIFLRDQNLYVTLNLMKFRVSLMNNPIEEVSENLAEISDEFNFKQKFNYESCQGIMFYQRGLSKQAQMHFENASDIVEGISLDDWEIADFNYMFGLVNFSNYKNFRAREYIKKSLFYYRDNLFFLKLIDCYIINGLILKRGGEYKEALENFNLALRIVDNFNLLSYKGVVLHNIGDLESNRKRYCSSKEHYVKSLEYKDEAESRLITMLNLVADSFETDDLKAVLSWSEEALAIIKKEKKTVAISFFYHQFMIYKSISIKEEDSIPYLIKAISFFEKNNYMKENFEYSKLLGKILYSQKRYKLSSYYYEKSVQSLDEIENYHRI